MLDEEAIFAAAIEEPSPGDRAAYLNEACAGDLELRSRVEALLAAYDNPDSFLEAPPAQIALDSGDLARETTSGRHDFEAPGRVIGPYKLLEQIGEGGMGVVYMADQQQPVRRRVALKIIKPGMDTRQVIARFEAERQALAMMDHPNISRVLDAGATGPAEGGFPGRPYFVMELVQGVPITDYSDAQHLPVSKRLELMATVCQAVQHAHQKGLIHRDLKPSNVLVAEYDGKPVPKIIDFGVAKAIESRSVERSFVTEQGQIVGTFKYMSPEQAAGSPDIDTRSDVYSLGVLLYELLAGSPPFDAKELRSKGYGEVQRIIREVDPPAPSTKLSRLDALPTVAANRQTEPRVLYQTVHGELDWIVMKCLEKDRSRRYESAAALAADVGRYQADEPVSAGPPSRAYQLRKFVRRNRITVITSTAVLLALIAAVIGATLGLISESRRRVAAERERAAMELNVATALERQERYAEAEDLYRKALASRGNDISAGQQETARTLLRLGWVVARQHRVDEAEQILRDAVSEYRQAFPPNDPNIAHALGNAAQFLRDFRGKHVEAEDLHREALAIHRKIVPKNHFEIAKSLLNVGNELCWQQKYAEAEPIYRESVAEYEQALPPGDAICALARMEYAVVLIRLKRFAEAEPLLIKDAETLRPNAPWRVFSASALVNLYTMRDKAEPGKSYDAKAREWSLKLLDGFFPADVAAAQAEANAAKEK